VSNFEWGDQKALGGHVNLILLEGMRDLITEVQMQFLEICSNLVSSIQHNSFEGHFKLGMITLVSKERGDHGQECEVLLYANSARGRRLTNHPVDN